MTYGFGDRCSTTELNSRTDCKRVKMIKGELDKPQNKTHTRTVYSLILRARICTLHNSTPVGLCIVNLYNHKRLPIPPPQYNIYMKRRLLFMFLFLLFLLSDNFYILIFCSKFINFSMSIKENIYMISTDFSTNIFCCINSFTNFYL